MINEYLKKKKSRIKLLTNKTINIIIKILRLNDP
jgi:hypothetical protein